MKYLSFILAFMVLILSTVPCFREDRCIKPRQQTTQNQQQGKDGCAKCCCSPFMNCKTCMGFVMTLFHFSSIHPIKQTEKKIAITFIKPISDFPYSVWHPPQLT